MIDWIMVIAGGALGAATRLLLDRLISRKWNDWPAGTWAANMAGSFLLGIAAGALITGHAQTFHAIGIAGALSTFSTFAVEIVEDVEKGKYSDAFTYVILSLTVGILAYMAGMMLGRGIFPYL